MGEASDITHVCGIELLSRRDLESRGGEGRHLPLWVQIVYRILRVGTNTPVSSFQPLRMSVLLMLCTHR